MIQAEKTYQYTKLQAHPGKRVRRSLHAKAGGVELEGERGLVGPMRGRLLSLACLTASAAEPGPIDMKTLEGILGLWGYCTQFRRPLLSFAFDLYHEAPPEGVGDPFRLSRGARNELLVLACLAPLCVTDLRAIPDDFIYCVDASPSGAGVCRTRVGREVCRELWRRGEKQGYRMLLLTSLSATLKGSGWDEEEVENWLSDAEAVRNEDDVAPEGQYISFEGDYVTLQLSRGWRPEAALPCQLADPVFDFLELYAGYKRMSAAWARKGFSVLPPVELKDGLDLRDGELCSGLMRLIRRGGVRFLWRAPP